MTREEGTMTIINDATLKDIKYIIHYKGGMSNGNYGIKDLIDKIENINRSFIFSYNKRGFFQKVFDFIKEIMNVKINCDFILNCDKYDKINEFYFLKSLKNNEVINSDRITIDYYNLNNKISSFLQRKMKNGVDEREYINIYLKNNVKTKGDFLLLYSTLNKLMSSIENKKNESRLKQTDGEGCFKFISRNDLFYKESIFNLLDSIYGDGESEANEIIKIKNINNLKKINTTNKEVHINNLIKFIHHLKEKEMRNELFLLKLENTLKNIKMALDSFRDNKNIQIVGDNLKALLPSYMQEAMMNNNKLINFDFEVYEKFDNSNDIYKDKIKLIFDEYKMNNRQKTSYIKNIIDKLELYDINNYLQFNKKLLNDLLLYLK